jgi:uncharacterized cupin superfamily protein
MRGNVSFDRPLQEEIDVSALGDGVFVAQIDGDGFELDDEVGGFVQVLFEDGETMGGVWKPSPAVATYPDLVLPARETIVVVAGSVQIEIENGPTLDLREGAVASMPKGAVTTWHPSPDFKEVWVYS